MTRLTPTELRQASPALTDSIALTTLTRHNGDLETSFAALWAEQHPGQSFNLDPFDVPSRSADSNKPDRSLLQSTLTVLRQELCGDQGFRGQLDEYRKDPSSAPLLNAAIATVSGLAIANGIPLDGTLAAIVVLYIAKIGLAVICDYTKPAKAE
ncbi:MAG: hypothetical protein HC824_00225 [Synechococcales cyanobacterium RM1_1_8]|nr:hypothetical protein [Synechococcales cyanobacterium RM1_1_8]